MPAVRGLPNVNEGRNWEIPNVVLGDSLISDVDRAVMSVHPPAGGGNIICSGISRRVCLLDAGCFRTWYLQLACVAGAVIGHSGVGSISLTNTKPSNAATQPGTAWSSWRSRRRASTAGRYVRRGHRWRATYSSIAAPQRRNRLASDPVSDVVPKPRHSVPAWKGTRTTVERALTLIEAGALDQGDVNQLADRVGVGARHLSRLFARHLDASPLQVALSLRIRRAKCLLDDTRLPIRLVAERAGFSSARRLNAAFAQLYGKPLSAIRKRVPASRKNVTNQA